MGRQCQIRQDAGHPSLPADSDGRQTAGRHVGPVCHGRKTVSEMTTSPPVVLMVV